MPFFRVHAFSSLFLVLLLVSVSDLLQGGANLTLVACIAYSVLLQFCVTQCSNLEKKDIPARRAPPLASLTCVAETCHGGQRLTVFSREPYTGS